MEVGMSLHALVSSPRFLDDAPVGHFLFSSRRQSLKVQPMRKRHVLVVEAKGKKGMVARQFQRPPPPPLPKIEDDGNPKFVIFIRMANVYLWYPLSIVQGGTTAKIMVAAKDNFLGKYIYKDTLDRNLAAVIYRDEKEIQKSAFKQYRVLQSATDFRYGYKLINGNVRAALSTTDVIELPTKDQLKTVLDKVKDFFGDAKESFGKITSLGSTTTDDESKEDSKEKAKVKG
ncbi:protein HHL1, chloroplastic isoform X2 [Abrus precatorius]|uniref:Protein HHL1, chloroplastic isoform X2 n=1 Tax=Abrus precatorius TaxID=3816 RepID=A0A8B8JWC1_ABRPR|nr:protein HHL1, chloroplastic isoform X2 [Abrus precatorius]